MINKNILSFSGIKTIYLFTNIITSPIGFDIVLRLRLRWYIAQRCINDAWHRNLSHFERQIRVLPTLIHNVETTSIQHEILADLDVDKFITVPIDLKMWSNVRIKEVAKNTKSSILKTKVNKMHKKIPHATLLIRIR